MDKTIKMNLLLKKYFIFKIESEKKYKKIIKKKYAAFHRPHNCSYSISTYHVVDLKWLGIIEKIIQRTDMTKSQLSTVV